MPTQWIITPRPSRTPAARLVCVPHAGGGIATFRGWSDHLPSADVGVVQLPGRGSRLREPLADSLEAAARGVAEAVVELPARPTVLFGHSLGALIAFEAARMLGCWGWPVLALFVSGQRAPTIADPNPPISGLPSDAFITEIRRRYDSVPDAFLADAELMQLLVPGLRADFAMLEGYRYQPAPPLDCPIVACGGSADPHASRSDLEAWRRETRGRSSVHLFSGGHFYLQKEWEALTTLIGNQLTVLLGAMSRWTAVR